MHARYVVSQACRNYKDILLGVPLPRSVSKVFFCAIAVFMIVLSRSIDTIPALQRGVLQEIEHGCAHP